MESRKPKLRLDVGMKFSKQWLEHAGMIFKEPSSKHVWMKYSMQWLEHFGMKLRKPKQKLDADVGMKLRKPRLVPAVVDPAR